METKSSIDASMDKNRAVRFMCTEEKELGAWISVNDRLPERESCVLVTYGGFYDIAILDCHGVWRGWGARNELFNVTYWMPLPEAPEEKLKNITHWDISTKGIYRYIVSAICRYEIVLLDNTYETDIMDAKALLFITGDWCDQSTGLHHFGREQLEEGTVRQCLEAAAKDYTEEMTED